MHILIYIERETEENIYIERDRVEAGSSRSWEVNELSLCIEDREAGSSRSWEVNELALCIEEREAGSSRR